MPSDSDRAAHSSRLCVGLISGTSADAVEAALCRIEGTGEGVRLTLLGHVTRPFSPEFTQRLIGPQDARSLCELNFSLGEDFAQAALEVIAKAGVSAAGVAVIGSHGQTLAHLPQTLSAVPSTLQVGEASVIAERTGIPVVSDFRTRDVAAGGHGAPLVPYFDWALFRCADGRARALQNIGGIANVSVVASRLEDTVAFDTGPGNMVLDSLARRVSRGTLHCDRDGQLSARGRVIPTLLDELLAHEFFGQSPPRTAGRESFGDALAGRLWERYSHQPHDLVATAAALTVESIARAYETYILGRFSLEGMYVSGGGSRNPSLLEGLRRRLAPLHVQTLDALGFPEAAKEAACFALLASEHVAGTPANVPSATGARRRVILGKLTP